MKRLAVVSVALVLALLVVFTLAPDEGAPPASREGEVADRRPGGAAPARARVRADALPPAPLPALPRGTRGLSGRVLDPEGRPLANARLRVVRGPRGEVAGGASARSDAGGAFRFQAEAEGTWVLWAACTGYAGRHVPLEGGRPARIVLAASGALAGTCRDGTGRALRASVEGHAGDWSRRVETDAAGRFEFADAPAGLVALRARPAPGDAALPARGEAVVRAGERSELDLVHALGQTLRGSVRDAAGGELAGVRVVFRARDELGAGVEARLDAGGRFELAGVAPGEGTLLATRGDRSAGPVSVLVPLGSDPDPVDLELEPTPELEARIVAAGSGLSVALARVRLQPEAGEALEVRSDVEGRADLGHPVGGHYRLRVEASGFAPFEVSFERGEEPLRELFVELRAGGRLRGQVLGPEGAPVPRAALSLLDGSGRSARADEAGAFEVGELPEGEVALRATAEGFGSGHVVVYLAAGEEREVRVFLGPPATLEGQVLDEAAEPLAGAVVRVEGPADDRFLQSDAQGRFRVDDLGPGPFRVEASQPGYLRAQVDWLSPGDLATLVLERAWPVVGRVQTSDGSPVHAVLVAPAEDPARGQLFEGDRFALVVGEQTRQLIVRARAGPAHHGHGPSFLAPLRVNVPRGGGTLDVALAAGEEAEGVVLDAAGDPVPGAAFLYGRQREEDLGGASGRLHLLSFSEGGGHFEVPGVPPEGLPVTVSHPEHGPLFTRLRPGEQRLRLPAGAALSGEVTGPEGLPARGVPLLLEGPVVRRLESDARGAYRVRGLAAGTYTLTRMDTRVQAEVTLAAGRSAQLNLP